MESVGHVLVMLQPVAGHDRSAARADAAVVGFDHLPGIERFQALVARQHWFLIGRAHIGEEEPITLLHRIPGLAHAVALEAAFGLAGLFEAAPLHIEQPAVVAAADAALLDAGIVEGGPAVAATRPDQSGSACSIPEQDEIFPQDADCSRRCAGIRDEADRVPITPQQLSHGLAAINLGQRGVMAGRLALIAGTAVD